MRSSAPRNLSRTALAVLTVVAFTTPLADGMVCAANAGRVAEMRDYQLLISRPSAHQQSFGSCARMSCCRGRWYTCGAITRPFTLRTAWPRVERPAAEPQTTYSTFRLTPLPPPRG